MGYLVMHAMPASGRRYTHRCPPKVFELVADAIEDAAVRGVTSLELVQNLGAKHSSVNVALRFLEERGLTVRWYKRIVPAKGSTCHLDAMLELAALAGDGAARPM